MNKSIYLSVLAVLLAGFISPAQAFPSRSMTQTEIADYYKLSQGRYSAAATPKSSAVAGGATTTATTETTANTKKVDSKAIAKYVGLVAGGAGGSPSGLLAAGTSVGGVKAPVTAAAIRVAGGAGGSPSGLLAAGTSVGGVKTPVTAAAIRKFTNLSTLGLSQDQISKNNQNQLKALLALLSK